MRRISPSNCIKSQDTEHAHQTGYKLPRTIRHAIASCWDVRRHARPIITNHKLFDSKHERHAAYTLQPSHNPSGWLQTRRYTRKAQVIRTQKRRRSVGLSPFPSSIYPPHTPPPIIASTIRVHETRWVTHQALPAARRPRQSYPNHRAYPREFILLHRVKHSPLCEDSRSTPWSSLQPQSR
jgi:hypothetical protein